MADTKTIKALKPEAKKLYLSGKSAKDILALLKGIPTSTLYGWINKEKWSEIRDQQLSSYTNIREILFGMLDNLIQRVPKILSDTKINEEKKADMVAKIMDGVVKGVSSIKKLLPEQDRLSSIIFTVGEMANLLSKKESLLVYDENFRIIFDKFLSDFQVYAIEKYSPKNINK